MKTFIQQMDEFLQKEGNIEFGIVRGGELDGTIKCELELDGSFYFGFGRNCKEAFEKSYENYH